MSQITEMADSLDKIARCLRIIKNCQHIDGADALADPISGMLSEEINRFSKLSDKFRCKEMAHTDGGSGSGNWGHAGRPGKRGGSAGGGGKHNRTGSKESGYSSKAKDKTGHSSSGANPFNDRMKSLHGKSYSDVDKGVRSALKDLPVGGEFTHKGAHYTKTGDNEFTTNDGKKATLNAIANGVNCSEPSTFPEFKGAGSGGAAPAPSKGAKQKYEGSLNSPYGNLSQETMNQKLQEMARNQISKEGKSDIDSKAVQEMVFSVQHYGTAGECQMMLAMQDPAHYKELFSRMSEAERREYAAEADKVEKFIELSDKYKGSLYRGIGLDNTMYSQEQIDRTISSLKKGNEINMGHIASWSTEKGVARSYSENVLESPAYQNGESEAYTIVYQVTGNKSGVNLKGINPEGECITPKSARYKVSSVSYDYDEEEGIHSYAVELEEL